MTSPSASAPHFNANLIHELSRLRTVSRIAAYSHSHSHAHTSTSAPPLATSTATHEADLASTSTSLRRLLIDEELLISTLASQLPSAPNRARHLRARVVANREAFATTGYLPPAGSALNTLLAVRAVLANIQGNEEAVVRARAALEEARRELVAVRARAGEARLLGEALEGRVQELERGGGGEAEGVQEVKARVKETRRRAARTMKLLQKFFGARLKALLEIEELGGPVAELAVESVDAKRAVGRASGQMTLQEAFRAGRKRRGRAEEEGEEDVDDEMRGLLETLMNKSMEADTYVELEMESAVARFLVRAKVAEFHPRDARKIRMVGFGGAIGE